PPWPKYRCATAAPSVLSNGIRGPMQRTICGPSEPLLADILSRGRPPPDGRRGDGIPAGHFGRASESYGPRRAAGTGARRRTGSAVGTADLPALGGRFVARDVDLRGL